MSFTRHFSFVLFLIDCPPNEKVVRLMTLTSHEHHAFSPTPPQNSGLPVAPVGLPTLSTGFETVKVANAGQEVPVVQPEPSLARDV